VSAVLKPPGDAPAHVAAVSEAPTEVRKADTARLGLWVFLATEVMFFGGLLLAYRWSRGQWPLGFAEASRHTHVLLGTLNTGLLLTSSALMAGATAVEPKPGARRVAWLLWASALLGVAFLGVKGLEYAQEWQEGLFPGRGFALAGTPGAPLFFVFYWAATALHALHLVIGIGVLAWFAHGVRRQAAWAPPRRVEMAGLYWHFVDVVWILLYPLIYLVGRAA
jgi:cytochrome c oxidase subunit 3